ncbi:hypothetical protein L3Q82_023891, partial [Scortum barcoo]
DKHTVKLGDLTGDLRYKQPLSLLGHIETVSRNGLTAAAPVKMHSRLQELKKEEETLLKIKVMLQDQLNRLKVSVGSMSILGLVTLGASKYYFNDFEEGALKSIINAQIEGGASECSPTETEVHINLDDESEINRTKLLLNAAVDYDMEEEEEEEEEDDEDEDEEEDNEEDDNELGFVPEDDEEEDNY